MNRAFLKDEEIVRIATVLYESKQTGEWQQSNQIILHKAKDDDKVKKIEFSKKFNSQLKFVVG